MTCSHVMNECLQGQFCVITTNHVTSSYVASKNVIYVKLETLIENNIFCPSSPSVPIIMNSSMSIQDQWTQAIAIISAQHQKEMQSMVNTNTASS
ncbi:unnamed protein product [Rotaria sp. Silwood2]|nr:unnamed protein product [Rotaria sp. Silwood2]CAF3323809.1 unnamed protein product [Rotaria sp. Silwood2]CAF3967897.1 unnamed protein product [Rotaria sp. Silwood2]